MNVSLSIDVACHLGKVRNIDLMSRGFYYVEISLAYCDQPRSLISPIRCFSAPSTLVSCVRDICLQPAPLLNMCNVQDKERIFQSRSFMIRYKDECHELNDGCFWRFVVPRFDLDAMGGTAPRFAEPLLLTFKLMYAELLDEVDDNIDTSPEKFVPDMPEWSIAASQSICIQCPDSSTHEFFPVSVSCKFLHHQWMISIIC